MSTEEPRTPTGRSWRRHSEEFKTRVIELARQPGVSTAAVALANGLNANMLRRWVREADECAPSSGHNDTVAVVPAFVQLPMPQETPPTLPLASTQAPSTVAVEIRRGDTTVQAELQMDARSAAWLREVLG
ncbi:transposase [Roseateles sp. SL47]|uniref:transposase n=1 Tax=Roseateles sp. SL47 TaxID=2995138 RepID=UPI002271F4E9|nr:transposase [Roseateles sp. SL47]WAC73105.1 transposase [Roseateles sp. SL47]WAC74237.1 transposase [Roseateles sp. SL47]WAC74692.1 transposase [Roseateles sp. SL47]WAC75714.1 transposase [Roseateles sp. SL47]